MDTISSFEIFKVFLPYIYQFILPYLLVYVTLHCLTSLWLFLIHLKNGNKLEAFLSWIPLVKLYSYSKAGWVSMIRNIIVPLIVLIGLFYLSNELMWDESLEKLWVILYVVWIGYQMIMWLLLIHWISKNTGNNYIATIGLFVFTPIFLPILWILFIKDKVFNKKILWISYLAILLILVWNFYYDKKIKQFNNTQNVWISSEDNKVETNNQGKSSYWKCKTIREWDFDSIDSGKDFLWWFDSKNYFFHISKDWNEWEDDIEYPVLNWENLMKQYDSVWNFYFSDDTKHYAYVAKKDTKSILVVDGQEKDNTLDYNYNTDFGIKFSASGESILYSARRWEKVYFFIDDDVISEWFNYKEVPEIIYSENFETIVYKKNKRVKVEGSYEYIYDYYIDDDKISRFPTRLEQFSLSKDWSIYAFIIDLWQKSVLYINWEKISTYNAIGNLRFFDDNTYLYQARDHEWSFIVDNNKEWKKYKQINEIQFSPNGKEYVYITTNDEYDEEDYSKNYDREWFIVNQDWDEWKKYNEIEWLYYSPSGDKNVYLAEIREGYKKYIVINWKEWKEYWKIDGYMFDKKTEEVVYIASEWWLDWGDYFIKDFNEIKRIEFDIKSDYSYQGEVIKETYVSDIMSIISSTWEIIYTSEDTFSWIPKNEELYKYAKNYEKYDEWYVSDNRENALFIWYKEGISYVVRNGEELIATKDSILEIYPIDNGNSFIYRSSKSWKDFATRTLVECN